MKFIYAFVMDIRNSYFSHNGWNSARGWCVSSKKSMVKSREFIKIIFLSLQSRHQTENKRTESALSQEAW